MDTVEFRLSESQTAKLTDWKNEPTLQTLKQDLEASKPAQQAQMLRIQGWNDLMFVKGKEKPAVIKGRSSVQPKLIRRQAEWRYSALTEPFLSSEKLFKVTPVTFEDDKAATQNELLLNWQFRTKVNRIKFIDDFVRANVDEGTAIVRVGWKRSTVTLKKTVPVWSYFEISTQEQADALKQAMAAKDEDPRTFADKADPSMVEAVSYFEENQVATVAQQTGEETVPDIKVLENRPTVEVLNPKNVYIDPSCNGDLDKALFVIVSFETNKAELIKEGKRYKNLDRVNWESNAPTTDGTHTTSTPQTFALEDKLRRKVVAYEYWGYYDVHGDDSLVPFVATWIGDTLIRLELNPYPDEKLPFVMVTYLPVKRDLYGEPDAELLEDNQKILGAVTRGMIDLMGRSANSQQGMAKGMLDAINKKRFDNGEDYEFNPNVSPQNGVIEHKYPELPQSAMAMLGLQNQEAEALTGVKSFSGGLSGNAYGDVATNTRSVLDAASKREMAILRRLAKGMTDIGQKIIAMNAEFLSEEEVVRVTNDEFVTIKREDIKGNFDLVTDISTAEVDNAKSQDLAMMIQTIGPNVDSSILLMMFEEIARLKRMPALAHKLKMWKPAPPTPEQQQMQQLELQKAQLEVEVLKSQIAVNEANAKQLGAKADKTNLDYVEQETGTAHARNMQQQEAQSKGNQNLQITKALTQPVKEGEKRPDIESAVGFNAVGDRLALQS